MILRTLHLCTDTYESQFTGLFEAVLKAITQAPNPIAESRQFWSLVWGPQDMPDSWMPSREASSAVVAPGRIRPTADTVNGDVWSTAVNRLRAEMVA